MSAGYTELFFYDEAVALAAGHRPCFECRRSEAKHFAACWAQSKGLSKPPKAGEMDQALHAERLSKSEKRLHQAQCSALPPLTFIAVEGEAFCLQDDHMRRWSLPGYGERRMRPTGEVTLLTPPSIVEVLQAGYFQSAFS